MLPLRKQPLVHVFPGEETPRRPEPPPNRIIRNPPFPALPLSMVSDDGPPPAALRFALGAVVVIAAAVLVMLALAAGDMIHGHP